MSEVQKTVFISYRRTNYFHARAVELELTNTGYDVFLDYDSLDSGAFSQIIVNQIAARAHFLIVLTPSALERCIDPDDWMRKEIEEAIDHQRNIIPLLFDNFDFRTAQQYLISEKLALLPNYNGLEVPISFFNEAMERLRTRFLNKPLELILHPIPNPKQTKRASNQRTIQPKTALTEVQLRAEYDFEQGFARYQSGIHDDAIADFTHAIMLNPKFAEAFYWRGHAYRWKNIPDLAIADWQEAIRLAPEDRRVNLFYCSIYRIQKDFDRALVEADKAIHLNSNDPEVFNNRGNVYLDKGQNDNAIIDFTEALRLNPYYSVAYNGRGRAKKAKGDLDDAIADFDQAIVLNPRYAAAYNNRGSARKTKGDLNGAIADFDESIRLYFRFATAYNNRGTARKAKGDLNGAIADYETAARIDPNLTAAKINLKIARRLKD